MGRACYSRLSDPARLSDLKRLGHLKGRGHLNGGNRAYAKAKLQADFKLGRSRQRRLRNPTHDHVFITIVQCTHTIYIHAYTDNLM
jgi:hypothetical protein